MRSTANTTLPAHSLSCAHMVVVHAYCVYGFYISESTPSVESEPEKEGAEVECAQCLRFHGSPRMTQGDCVETFAT